MFALMPSGQLIGTNFFRVTFTVQPSQGGEPTLLGARARSPALTFWGWLTGAFAIMASSTGSSNQDTGTALLSDAARDSQGSPALRTSGSALPTASGSEG